MQRAVLLALVVALAGCGDGSPGRAPTAATGSSEPPGAETAAPPAREAVPHPPRPPRALRTIRALAKERDVVSETLTRVARELGNLAPTVYCWDERGWRRVLSISNRELPPEERGEFDGIADLYGFDIHLAPWVCDALEHLPERRQDDIELAAALSVFAHETRHLSPAGDNEAAAECAGLQIIAPIAQALGLQEAESRKLARIAWEQLYPTLPAAYRSPECRPGGNLDREPETPDFP